MPQVCWDHGETLHQAKRLEAAGSSKHAATVHAIYDHSVSSCIYLRDKCACKDLMYWHVYTHSCLVSNKVSMICIALLCTVTYSMDCIQHEVSAFWY